MVRRSLILLAVLLVSLVPGWQALSRADARLAGFGYGANVADLENAGRLREMGFGWMKSFLAWERIEPSPGVYDWADLSKVIGVARKNGLRLLLRIDRVPSWARPSNSQPTAPPDAPFLGAWGEFLGKVASRARGHVDAYEIWNEPNLAWQWGGRPPDPSYYSEMLRIAYQRMKQADPQALVVSAGLAPTRGDGGQSAMDNLLFLRAMYSQGAAGYFDVLGSHPYGFSLPPEADPREAASFREAELERLVMVGQGDGAKPVWATEAGWLLDPAAVGLAECREHPAWREALWQVVDQEAQALYLAGAYQYARQKWPWMGAMFVFNLDFSLAPWYPDPCEPMAFYSLLAPDGEPRASFEALRRMPKAGTRNEEQGTRAP